MGRSQSCRNAPRKDPPLEMKLGLTLEELYVGVTKKMKISRNVGSPLSFTSFGQQLCLSWCPCSALMID